MTEGTTFQEIHKNLCRLLSRLLLFTSLLVAFPRARATSILVLQTDRFIYLASDSHVTYSRRSGSTEGLICKTHAANGYTWAVAGVPRIPEIGWDVDLIAESAFKKNKPFEVAVADFRRELSRQFPRARSAAIAEGTSASDAMIEVAIVRLDNRANSSPRLAIVSYDKASSRQKICPVAGCNRGQTPFLYEMGERTAIDKVLNADPRFFLVRSTPDALTDLIKLEARAKPHSVEEPIALKRFEHGRVSWVSKGSCQ